MKYTFQWILVAVCLFVVGNVQVMADGDKEKDIVPIPISTGDLFTGSDARDGGFVPLYSGNTVKVGRNVTNKKAQGNVVINNGNVNIVGNRVELQAGTKVSKGAVLKIKTP